MQNLDISQIYGIILYTILISKGTPSNVEANSFNELKLL